MSVSRTSAVCASAESTECGAMTTADHAQAGIDGQCIGRSYHLCMSIAIFADHIRKRVADVAWAASERQLTLSGRTGADHVAPARSCSRQRSERATPIAAPCARLSIHV